LVNRIGISKNSDFFLAFFNDKQIDLNGALLNMVVTDRQYSLTATLPHEAENSAGFSAMIGIHS